MGLYPTTLQGEHPEIETRNRQNEERLIKKMTVPPEYSKTFNDFY
jgi:hypothetical protein